MWEYLDIPKLVNFAFLHMTRVLIILKKDRKNIYPKYISTNFVLIRSVLGSDFRSHKTPVGIPILRVDTVV